MEVWKEDSLEDYEDESKEFYLNGLIPDNPADAAMTYIGLEVGAQPFLDIKDKVYE